MTAMAKAVQDRGFLKSEVAALFRISERTLDRMIARGELPVYRVGRSVRVPVAVVEARLRKAV